MKASVKNKLARLVQRAEALMCEAQEALDEERQRLEDVYASRAEKWTETAKGEESQDEINQLEHSSEAMGEIVGDIQGFMAELGLEPTY